MLSIRQDHVTNGKVVLYWDKKPVPSHENDKHYTMEIKRLKVALDYEVAKREAIADELEEEIKKTDAILKYADAMINRGRKNV